MAKACHVLLTYACVAVVSRRGHHSAVVIHSRQCASGQCAIRWPLCFLRHKDPSAGSRGTASLGTAYVRFLQRDCDQTSICMVTVLDRCRHRARCMQRCICRQSMSERRESNRQSHLVGRCSVCHTLTAGTADLHRPFRCTQRERADVTLTHCMCIHACTSMSDRAGPCR